MFSHLKEGLTAAMKTSHEYILYPFKSNGSGRFRYLEHSFSHPDLASGKHHLYINTENVLYLLLYHKKEF